MFWVPTQGSFGLDVWERCRCEWRTNRWMKNEKRTKPPSSSRGSNRYTMQSGKSWGKLKNSINHSMKIIGLIISYRLETGYGSTLARRGWRVKERSSIPFVMGPSLSWRKVVTMLFVYIFHLICKFTQLWMLITWNFLSLPWSWIKMRKFQYHQLMSLHMSTWMSYRKISSWTGGWGLLVGVMLIIFE